MTMRVVLDAFRASVEEYAVGRVKLVVDDDLCQRSGAR